MPNSGRLHREFSRDRFNFPRAIVVNCITRQSPCRRGSAVYRKRYVALDLQKRGEESGIGCDCVMKMIARWAGVIE